MSGTLLKLLAILSMTIDHIALFLLYEYPPFNETLITIGQTNITMVWIMRTIGRMAFPIFCLLLVEGFKHTKNREKYGINLLVFAIISEIIWNLIQSESWTNIYTQNVFFTLFWGFMGMVAMDKFKYNKLEGICLMLITGVMVIFTRGDYYLTGWLFIILLYIARHVKKYQIMIVGAFLWPNFIAMVLTTGTTFLYNKKRGWLGNNASWKYAFYVYYPIHLTIIYLLK